MRGEQFLNIFFNLQEETGIPAAYLYALTWGESGFKPGEVTAPSSHGGTFQVEPGGDPGKYGAVGLMQVVNEVLKEYNKVHDTVLTRRDMLDPTLNAHVATWQLTRIRDAYERYVPSLHPNWQSRSWVTLFTMGWNSGPYGLIRVAGRLYAQGKKVTPDSVKKASQGIVKEGVPVGYGHLRPIPAKAYRYLASRNLGWAKRVAERYMLWRKKPPFTAAVVG